jgi:hypothetical protein
MSSAGPGGGRAARRARERRHEATGGGQGVRVGRVRRAVAAKPTAMDARNPSSSTMRRAR